MKKIMITQSILWAAAIITIAIVAPSESGWLLLTVLATIALGTLKKGIEFINFSSKDVIRHQLVKNIINAYEESNGKK